jgi:hypothetical protein
MQQRPGHGYLEPCASLGSHAGAARCAIGGGVRLLDLGDRA